MIILRVRIIKEEKANYLIKAALKINLLFIITSKISLYFCKMIKITLSPIMFSMNLKKKN